MILNYDQMWLPRRLAVRLRDRREDQRVFGAQRETVAKSWGADAAAMLGSWAPVGRTVVRIDSPDMHWKLRVIGDWRPWMRVGGKWIRCESAITGDRFPRASAASRASGLYGWWQIRAFNPASGQMHIALEPPFALTLDVKGAMVMHALSGK